MTRLLAVLCVLPCLAHANPYKDSIDDASEALEDAVNATRRASPSCQGVVGALNHGVEELDSVRQGTTERRLKDVLLWVTQVQSQAVRAGCPQKVNDRIALAVTSINAAFGQLDRDDHRGGHHRHHDDGDDDRHDDRRDPPPPPGRSLEAAMGELRIIYGDRLNGELGVRVEVPSASVRGLGRAPFYFAGHLRSQSGEWTEWVAGPQITAPQDPYVWNNVYSQFFPARLLRSAAGDRFVVHVALFDANRNELAFKEGTIDLAGGQPNPPPAPPAVRDCGTGDDSGCGMQRGRGWAMDRESFVGFYNSLKGTASDLTKAEMCRSVLGNNWVTAKQLGMILDLFNSDLIRLDVGKLAAPHTVDPLHALGLSSHFRSSLSGSEFTRVMSDQR